MDIFEGDGDANGNIYILALNFSNNCFWGFYLYDECFLLFCDHKLHNNGIFFLF